MTDREKAIEILQRLADEKTEELNIFDDEGGDVCGQILEEQDAILAGIEALKERPHGEWQYEKLGYLSTHNCSRCGGAGNHLWKFCPFCGAYMRPKGGETEWKSEV